MTNLSRRNERMRGGCSGVTLLELIFTIAILMIISSAAVETFHIKQIREHEWELRRDLREIRDAIDKYKDLSDRNLIRSQVGSEGYPPSLDVLVQGVDIGPSGPRIRFLRRVPVDPITKRTDWVLQSIQQDSESTDWDGNNVFDVHSRSQSVGLDGTSYATW